MNTATRSASSPAADNARAQRATCSLRDFLASERTRTDELWHEVASQVRMCALAHETFHTAEVSNLEALKRNIRKFVRTMRLRMGAEEQLFALIDEIAWRPRGDGLIGKLRSEHQRIGEFLDLLDRTRDDSTCAATIETVEGRLAELAEVLPGHGDAEWMLFLQADHILPAAEVHIMLDGMQKWILDEV